MIICIELTIRNRLLYTRFFKSYNNAIAIITFISTLLLLHSYNFPQNALQLH